MSANSVHCMCVCALTGATVNKVREEHCNEKSDERWRFGFGGGGRHIDTSVCSTFIRPVNEKKKKKK